MFERFTDQARDVVDAARDEARLMRHAHIGTEHLLVGIARGEDDAAALLHRHGLTGERARAEVVRMVGMGEDGERGQLAFTPAAHDALHQTIEEAMRLGHERADAAHLLLAILRQPDALARRILLGAGAAPRDVRAELTRRLGERPATAPHEPAGIVSVRLDGAVAGELGNPGVDGRLLLEILQRHGAVAAWLRERGVDEAAVRRMLGG
ncbi:Clp protease N-terminal domain-containing protein [Candidatus Solirubrobacter pratensis]|uniref:Clp protease N-terminal domain-containing protein n=1 Tax=Candidatus Solirubrobacter pratensis TaxID=1298857 RepID=UPI000413DDD7|nr:Clp protease N-terminal domain-containing protein [Candidatus Solirubrobacter pratensis]